MGELGPRTLVDRRRFSTGAGALAVAGLADFGLGRRRAAAKPGHGEPDTRAVFWARPQGPKGELIGYSLTDGLPLYTLPAGQIAADGSRFLAAVPAAELGATWLNTYDPWSGQLDYGWRFDGRWILGGISASGRFAALTSVPTDEQEATWAKSETWRTEILVVDLEEDPWPHRFVLDGNFEVEVLSARGDALFLVEHRPAIKPDHYVIRLYDLVLDALQEGELVDKRAIDEVMAGLAWDSVASSDGAWLLTLYLSTARDVAFVHTLNLVNRYPVCIDLPSGFGEFGLLKHYTQALAPDGRWLFTANPALGAIAKIDLSQCRVSDVASFAPVASEHGRSRSAVSSDGRAFLFTGGQDVWHYDTGADEVIDTLPLDGPIIGLGLSPDDLHILVARPESPLLALDRVTGAAAGFPIGS